MSGIRFWFRGEFVEVDDVAASESVLHWLRLSGASRGTKEGCNQGDCGACTVAISELVDGQVRLSTANSCLLLMPMLHGKALFTVEDVGTTERMHPVQQALVDNAGSQCGFCTPGFVMSMWATGEQCVRSASGINRDDVIDGLTGNLCRCTGYRPIVDAVLAATEQVVACDMSIIDWDGLASSLAEIRRAGDALVAGFEAPSSERELAEILAARPEARIVAGGTDLVVAMRAEGSLLDDSATFISVAGVASLARIDLADGHLVLGAAVSLEDAWSTLVERLPSLGRMHRRFASPAIRSTGTVGGNIANSSPVADLVPVLLALDAVVELRSSKGSRVLPLEQFGTGVRANVLQAEEFIARVRIPLAGFDRDLQAHKVSRRFDDDISSVSAVVASRSVGAVITDLRLVFGGMATTVRRAVHAEAALLGSQGDESSLRLAQDALARDFAPIDDHRASGWYRLRVAEGLLERWWLSRGATAVPDYDVWASR